MIRQPAGRWLVYIIYVQEGGSRSAWASVGRLLRICGPFLDRLTSFWDR